MGKSKKILGFKKQPLFKWVLYWTVVGMSTFILFFLVTTTLIGYSVKEKCEISKAKYGGSCQEALVSFLNDETNSLKQRNEAVWVLGQLGDTKSLPALQSYYTGEPCDHERFLCQYELEKAIKLLESGFNISALVWRHGQF